MADETLVRIEVDGVPRTVRFTPREAMKPAKVRNAFFESFHAPSLPPVSLPIDWTKGGTLQFPADGNETYGDCFYAAGCHQDQSMTGCVGTPSEFDRAAIIAHYLRLAGADRGLTEDQICGEWTNNGLAGDPEARIFDHVDIDAKNPALMRSAMHFFGGVQFQLAVPDHWLGGFTAGCVWDAPAMPNEMNGHAVELAGVDANGRYRVLTWGSYSWLTTAGVVSCDPSAFVVASHRWFDKSGYAPNGLHYTQLAPLWLQLGGRPWPASPYPAPQPAPTPGPSPTPGANATSGTFPVGPFVVSYTATLPDPPPA